MSRSQGIVRLFGGVALAFAFVGLAFAQTYPSKPIRMIVTVAAGGPIDTIGRLTAEQMQTDLGQPIVVENRAGAGGTVGARSVIAADPDGYTLLFSTLQTFAIAPALYQNPGYDPGKFVPVGLVAEFPFVFVIPAQIKATTAKEFVAFAKSTKDKLAFGGSLATPPHLYGELFKRTSDLDMVYVPYKGLAPSIGDLLSARTHMAFDAVTTLLPLIKEGKLRPLAVISSRRLAVLPDVPTMAESGYPNFPGNPWTGIVAPPGTSSAIVGRLNLALNASLATAATRERMEKLSLSPLGGTPERFAEQIVSDTPKWREIIALSGAKAE